MCHNKGCIFFCHQIVCPMIDLKKFRKAHGLSQGEIAEKTGIDRPRISKYETGKEISLTVERKILECYPSASEFTIDETIAGNFQDIVKQSEALHQQNLRLEQQNNFLQVQLEKALTMLSLCLERNDSLLVK